MRKAEREITNEQEKFAALLRCESMTLALRTDSAPYLVPLNFGAELKEDGLVLYFHCAAEGTKLGLLRADALVGFCAHRQIRVFNKGVAPCGYTTDYESVCGEGIAEIVTDERERLHGLKVLMAHYTDEIFSDETFAPRALAITTVVRIRVHKWTGKRLVRP